MAAVLDRLLTGLEPPSRALATSRAFARRVSAETLPPWAAPGSVTPAVLPLGMAQREKRSVSLPPDLARAVEQAARAEGTTFSAWLAETAAQRSKLEAPRQAIAEWERENGPLTEAELADGLARARSSLGRTPVPAAERRSA